jgi:PilZ domain
MDYLCNRCSDRREVELSTNCVLDDSDLDCDMKNIGVGGALLVSRRKPLPGQRGFLKFKLPKREGNISAEIEVVWARKVEDVLFGMGVKFTRASMDDLSDIFNFIGEQLLSDL